MRLLVVQFVLVKDSTKLASFVYLTGGMRPRLRKTGVVATGQSVRSISMA